MVAITGASGAVYGVRLVERLLAAGLGVDLILSDAGRIVMQQEMNLSWQDHATIKDYFTTDQLRTFASDNWFAPAASGSAGPRAMAICPCSMGTLAAVAHGVSGNLIHRAADVAIKERWPLVLVPRETPLSPIHLENMLNLARLGVTILPPAPAFYHAPRQINDLVDFVVERVISHLGVLPPPEPQWPPRS